MRGLRFAAGLCGFAFVFGAVFGCVAGEVLPPPIVRYDEGAHSADGDVPVTITAGAGASLVYTVDGSRPSLENGVKVDGESVEIILRKGESQVKAIAVGSGGDVSEVAEAAVVREPPRTALRKPPAPPSGGSGGSGRAAGSGAPPVIRGGGGAPYTAPATPRAKRDPQSLDRESGAGAGAGAGGGGLPGKIVLPGASSSQQVARPAIQPNGGAFALGERVTVRIGCATPGATIMYTTNGTTPSASNGMRLTPGGSITLPNKHTTVKAIAIKEGMRPSSSASALFSRAALKKP